MQDIRYAFRLFARAPIVTATALLTIAFGRRQHGGLQRRARAVLACYIPAARATRIDPVTALRAE